MIYFFYDNLLKCFTLKFLFDISVFNIPNVCSIWFSSGEYGGIVNTTHFSFFINSFTDFVLWILALSNITTILFSYVFLDSLNLNSISVSFKNSQNWSSFVVWLFNMKYVSLFHCAAMTLYLSELVLIIRSASFPFYIHE